MVRLLEVCVRAAAPEEESADKSEESNFRLI